METSYQLIHNWSGPPLRPIWLWYKHYSTGQRSTWSDWCYQCGIIRHLFLINDHSLTTEQCMSCENSCGNYHKWEQRYKGKHAVWWRFSEVIHHSTFSKDPCSANIPQERYYSLVIWGERCQLNREVNVAIISLVAMSSQAILITVLVVPHIVTPTQNSVLLTFHTSRISLQQQQDNFSSVSTVLWC